jgi:hypothetical protein
MAKTKPYRKDPSPAHTGLKKYERTFMNRKQRRAGKQHGLLANDTPTIIEIYKARESGLSWRLVGEMFGMSASTARKAYLEGVAQVVKESSSLEEARRKLNA